MRTYEDIREEIGSVERDLNLLNARIEAGMASIPDARRLDRQSNVAMRMHVPGAKFAGEEIKLRCSINENIAERDRMRERLFDLRAEQRALSRNGMIDPTRMTGTVLWFSIKRNFGFIEVSDDVDNVFLHGSSLCEAGTPETGMKVTFKRVKADRGYKAVNVRFVAE